MKSFKNGLLAAFAASAFTLAGAHAASWQDSLNSAASQLSGSSTQAGSGGMPVSSLTSLLSGSSQSLTASSMNNAAGILSYCAQQKLASVTSADNVKNRCWINWDSARRKNRNKTPTILMACRACSTVITASSWT
ncbi:Uncharacterized protein YjjA [Klebsiella variicola subsp. variicola]